MTEPKRTGATARAILTVGAVVATLGAWLSLTVHEQRAEPRAPGAALPPVAGPEASTRPRTQAARPTPITTTRSSR